MAAHLKVLLDIARQSDDEKAIKIYQQILAEAPTHDEAHFNLGLIYKHRHDWAKCFYHNQESAKYDPSFDGAWWNMGIAATMLKNWRAARRAWNHFGLKYEDSDAEITGQIGVTPIRTDPKGRAEVIWSKRIDPTRAMLENVPTLQSGRHYGDIVLHDGAPNGYRKFHGHEVPVFDEMLVIHKSDYLTFEIRMEGSNAAEMKEFERICEGYAVECENWTTNVGMVCKQCSEGRPHQRHDHELKPIEGVYLFGLAAKNRQQVEQVLESWMIKTKNQDIKIVDFG
jgi:hypothetical protein